MDELGKLSDKAKLIIAICKEEIDKHAIRKRELEYKHNVKIDFNGESMEIRCKSHYPDEKFETYGFDMEEWLDEQPKNKNLKNIPKEYGKSWAQLENAIVKRCDLKWIDVDEARTEFQVDDKTSLVVFSLWEKNWRKFRVEQHKGD